MHQDIPPSSDPPRVLAAGPDLFVVTPELKGPRDAVAFDWMVVDGSGRTRARGNVGPNFPSAWSSNAALLNLGWDPDARAATVAFTWNEEGVGRRIIRVPIRASGIGEPSVRRVGDHEAVTSAFAPGDRVLLADRTLRSDGHAEPLPLPEGACIGDRSRSCVVVQGLPRAGTNALAVLLTADGVIHRAADLPGSSDPLARPLARQRIAYATGPNAAAPRLSSYVGGRLLVGLADGKQASFEVRDAEDQHLLFGRVGEGRWSRIARGASPIDGWMVIAHEKGALAIDARARRTVVLDEALVPLDKPKPIANLRELAREKWSTADLDVKLFVAAFALFPPLFGLALLAERRRRREPGPRRALAAIGLWTVATLAFVVARHAALFPP